MTTKINDTTKAKLTVKEAAAYLNINRQKISKLINRGVLQTEENPLDTRQKLITLEQLERLKQYQEYGGTQPQALDQAASPSLAEVASPEEIAEVLKTFEAMDRGEVKMYTQEEVEQEIAALIASFDKPEPVA